MRWFVVIPGALVPAALANDVLSAFANRSLAAQLAHARLSNEPSLVAGATHWSWIWHQYGGIGQPITAPYAWRALNHSSAVEAHSEVALHHADPVHFAFARDHLIVKSLTPTPVTATEAQALAADAEPAVRDAGATLRVVGASHWFLSFRPDWSLDTVPLDAALAESVSDVMPAGSDASRWRKLLNDVQIGWHQHAVNAAREERGDRTINSLWLHGGGVWRSLPRAPFAAIASNGPVLRGWALASGLAPASLFKDDATPPARGDVLSLWRDLLEPARFEAWGDWLAALQDIEARLASLLRRSLDAGYRELVLVLCGRQQVRRVTLSAHDRYAFWRRSSMSSVFAEAGFPLR